MDNSLQLSNSWNVSKIDEPEMIRIVYEGKIDIEDIRQATFKALQLADNSRPTLFLNELINVEIDIIAFELQNIQFVWEVEHANRDNKLAIVNIGSDTAKEIIDFFVRTSQSLGWNVEGFIELDDAIHWLTQ